MFEVCGVYMFSSGTRGVKYYFSHLLIPFGN